MPTPEPSYREICLTQGQVAFVDVEDYERISKFNWHAAWEPNIRGFYARRKVHFSPGKPGCVSMHREILGLKRGDGIECDHINHNTLDNRRSNLRIATRVQQQINRRMPRNNKSGFKGVNRHQNSYEARIQLDGKRVHLGYYSTPEEAYARYLAAAATMHGEFSHPS